jgi:hypothetical protein
MDFRFWLFVICSLLWQVPAAATPRSQHVPLETFTRLTLDIVPDYGTQLVFPFVLDGLEPVLEINNTNSVGFTASHQTGQNTILVTANTPKAGGPAPDYRGLLFITVGGYRVAIELRTTAHVSKNLAEVIFDLSPERREFLITEAVKRRTAQLDQDYQARVAALDEQVEAKALNLVADMASSRPSTVRVKTAEDKTLNQATVEVYVDAWKVYPSFAILQFELTNRSATHVTVNAVRVSRPSDADGVQVGHGAFTCDRPLQPDATSRCSFTTRDVALVAAERLTLDVDTDRGALSLTW